MMVNFSIPKSFVLMNKTVKVVLEIVKLVVTAILGYFGGNAII